MHCQSVISEGNPDVPSHEVSIGVRPQRESTTQKDKKMTRMHQHTFLGKTSETDKQPTIQGNRANHLPTYSL